MSNRVAVFWDYENCRPPSNSNLPASKLANNIRLLVQGTGIIQTFKAYLDVSLEYTNPRSPALHSDLQSSGVTLVHCPHNGKKDVADKMMLVDMFTYAFDNPSPATIIIVTGDRDFAYAAATLKLRGYEVVLIAPSNIAHSSLKMQASRLYDWQRDVTGVLKSETVPSTPKYFNPATQTLENVHCEQVSSTVPPAGSSPPRVFQIPRKYPKSDVSPPSVFRSAKIGSKLFSVPGELPSSLATQGYDSERPKSTTVTENRRGVLKNSINTKSSIYENVTKVQAPDINAEDYAEDPNTECDPEIEESGKTSFKALAHIDSLSSSVKRRATLIYAPYLADSNEAEDDGLEPFSEPLPLSEENLSVFPSHLRENFEPKFGTLGVHKVSANTSDDGEEGCGCGICKRSSSAELTGSDDDPEPYEQIDSPDNITSDKFPIEENQLNAIPESTVTPISIPSSESFTDTLPLTKSYKYLKGPDNTSIIRFWTLVTVFIDEHARTGTKRIRSANVASEMRKRDPEVYEKAGVVKMKQYIEEARKARVIISPGLDNEGDGWIEIHDVFYPNIGQSMTFAHPPPPQGLPAKPTPDTNKKHSKAVFAPLITRLRAEISPHRLLYSMLGTYFATHHPTLYARANATGLSHYLAIAEKRGIVRIGGLDTPGRQWVELMPKHLNA